MEPISIFMSAGSESTARVVFQSNSDGNFQTSVSYGVSINGQDKGGKSAKISSENPEASVSFEGLQGAIRLMGESAITFSGVLTEGTSQVEVNGILVGMISYN